MEAKFKIGQEVVFTKNFPDGSRRRYIGKVVGINNTGLDDVDNYEYEVAGAPCLAWEHEMRQYDQPTHRGPRIRSNADYKRETDMIGFAERDQHEEHE